MRIFFGFILFFFFQWSVGQNIQVARSYYEQGKFNEALISFEALYLQNKNNKQAVLGLAKCYRQLERFPEAITLLENNSQKNATYALFPLELGVTFKDNKQLEKAKDAFDRTIAVIRQKPNQASYLAGEFKRYNLLKQAITCYQIAMSVNENLNFNQDIGRMYGELGDYANMFNSYLDLMIARPNYIGAIKRQMDEFVTDDAESEINITLRKVLLKKNQDAPDILYNELLSWLFVQQKQFRKAFLQEKAIYIKTGEGMPQLLNLSVTANQAEDYETAKQVLTYVVENTEIDRFKINADQQLMRLRVKTLPEKQFPSLKKEYEELLEVYKIASENFALRYDYAHFIGFKMNQKTEAIRYLKSLLKKGVTKIQQAKLEILLGDILVMDSKFNQALVYYTKAQKRVKNHELAQEALFKVAKASYFKGDFEWAKTQLNALKSATTQLIANDAMELALVIDDNTKEDTTFVALEKFAKAELYTFQEQKEKAMETYNELLLAYKGNSIEDDALYKQAKLYISEKQLDKAISNLEKIVQFYSGSLLIDDTFFLLGNLFLKKGEEEKAKANFEQIIFNHADSIHYVEARKAYRKLRGDTIVN